jgi:YD repeat-containing protein
LQFPWTTTGSALGRLTSQTDAKGQVTSLSYDAMGRVTSKTAGSVTANTYDEARAGYYNRGSLTTSAVPGRTHRYDRDVLGRLAKQTWVGIAGGQDREQLLSYWPGGELKTKILPQSLIAAAPAAERVDFYYDAAGRPYSLWGLLNGSWAELVQATQYNARGQVTGIAYGNGSRADYWYEPSRSLLGHVVVTPASGQGVDLI